MQLMRWPRRQGRRRRYCFGLKKNGHSGKNQNNKLAQENGDPFVTLPLNIQFWSAQHDHETKLHPNLGYGELNSIEVKSLETSNVPIQ